MWNGVEANNNLNRFLTRTGRQNVTTRRDKYEVGRTDGRGARRQGLSLRAKDVAGML